MYAIRSYYEEVADLIDDMGVDLQRQKRMTRAAAAFLKFHDLLECSARFDVVAVDWPAGSRQPKIEHIRITSYNVCYTKLLRGS